MLRTPTREKGHARRAAADLCADYEFLGGDEVFWQRVAKRAVDGQDGAAQHPSAVIETGEEVSAQLAEGRGRLADAIRDRTATATRDPETRADQARRPASPVPVDRAASPRPSENC